MILERERDIGLKNEILAAPEDSRLNEQTLQFVQVVYSEGAFAKKPPHMSERNWLRSQEIFARFCLGSEDLEQVAASYGLTEGRVQRIALNFIRRLRSNSSPETQERFPLGQVWKPKRRSLESRRRQSESVRGPSFRIAKELEAGKTIKEIISDMPGEQVTWARESLAGWGITVPHLRMTPLQVKSLEADLRIVKSDRDARRLLDKVTYHFYKTHTRPPDPRFVSLVRIANRFGANYKDVKDIFVGVLQGKVPVRRIEGKVVSDFILTLHQKRAIEILLSDPRVSKNDCHEVVNIPQITYGFLKAVIKEGVVQKVINDTPAYFLDSRVLGINITGVWAASPASQTEIGKRYPYEGHPRSRQAINHLIRVTLRRFHEYSSLATQKRYPLAEIRTDKSFPIIPKIKEHARRAEPAILELARKLAHESRDEEVQKILSGWTVHQARVLIKNGVVKSLRYIIEKAGLGIRSDKFQLVVDSLAKDGFPFGVTERCIPKGSQKGIQRYYLVRTQDVDRAVEILQKDPDLAMYKAQLIVQICGPISELPKTSVCRKFGRLRSLCTSLGIAFGPRLRRRLLASPVPIYKWHERYWYPPRQEKALKQFIMGTRQ